MSGDLQKYKQLTVISDTSLYSENGQTYGFGPVVRELEFIAPLFENIVWVGFDHGRERKALCIPITVPGIETVLVRPFGGNTMFEKLRALTRLPAMFLTVLNSVRNAEVVHTRAPSTPASVAILLSFLMKKKTWWNKYAGSWTQENPPFFFGLQRKLLLRAVHTSVTINGFHPEQPAHCHSFENPCITNEQLAAGASHTESRKFERPFRLAFVGWLSEGKGVDVLVDALRELEPELVERIDFVGEGRDKEIYRDAAAETGIDARFHGFLPTPEVHRILADSDFLILPSKAEGFPKVVAEACCWGSIPIVSDVGSVSDYVTERENGFIWKPGDAKSLAEKIKEVLSLPAEDLKRVSSNGTRLAEKFTFTNFRLKLQKLVLERG